MGKKCQTTKYRKRHEKEKANRKAKQLLNIHTPTSAPAPPIVAVEPQQLSPARRAFQNASD